jgi:Rhs element Vgr protein
MGSMVLPSQAYEVKLAPHPAPFSVLKFTGHDAVSQLYRYEVEFTSPAADIPPEKVLGRPAKFIIDPIDPNAEYLRHMFGENAEKFSDMPPARTIHGVVTQFVQFETSADETRYKLVIEPRTADLARGRKSRLFQKQSVQEIITETLRHYGFGDGVDFKFQLRAQYKRHEYITQYHESTFGFIQRIAADEGIWFRFEQVKNREVIIFGDDLDAYARYQRTVPLRRESGLESAGAEAIKSLERHMRRVPESVQLNDYNHRQAGVSLLVEANAARNDTTTNAVDSRWGEHYETPDEGQRIAQLRHEAHLAQQLTFEGKGNAFALEAGEVLKLDRNPADPRHGLFIVSVESSGGRRQAYWNTFTAIPSDRVWRTPVDAGAQPLVQGILPARITSPGDYQRAYLTPEGWYVAATGDISLARFLERVTAMRLKLQQITMSSDPDAMSRAAAQAVLQGKTSDIADSRDYASRMSASLGEQWAGFGDLFEQPLDQTWQVVLQPAASSLNETWRTAIVADWDKRFGGRYPFSDSDNDASLPEMARFMRPDNGVITQFVTSQLGGIVERQGDQWVPVQGANSSALTVDPEFLTALNKLVRVSTVLFPSGDAHVRYELRGVPTPGITDMKFVLSGRELHYFNQKQEWVPFVWPGDALENITRVEWQTQQGGLRSGLDMQGRFGLIRLLERAEVTPQDNARTLLSWTPDQSVGLPLRVQLRSEAGAGPLDVLALRHFSLPQRIFVTTSAKALEQQTSASPPSLPSATIAATQTATLAR